VSPQNRCPEKRGKLNLPVPEVVDVGVLCGQGAVLQGERGFVEDHGVVVVSQDVVDGDAHLHAGLLEDLAKERKHLVASVVVALHPGRGLVPDDVIVEKRRVGGHVSFFHRFVS
jgi:hypothetical protein